MNAPVESARKGGRGYWLTVGLVLGLMCAARIAHAQSVIAWGDNTSGKASVPASASNAVAVAAGGTHSLALRSDGSVIAWGAINTVPPEATNITAIAAGQNHNLALRDDGTVLAWGSNNTFGQSVAPTAATNIAAIAAGAFHNVALRSNGTILAWGRNDAGQTNVPPGLSNVIAVAAGTNQTLILQADGRLTVLGGTPGGSGALPTRPPLPVASFAAGQSHNLFLLGDGTLRAAGTSPVPTNFFTNRFSAVAANATANLAVRRDGRLFGWGSGATTNVPVTATNILAFSAGPTHGLAIRGDGALRLLGPAAFRSQVHLGEPLPLAARAVGREPIGFLWLRDGLPVPGHTNAQIPLTATLGDELSAFQVIVTNATGSVTSEVAQVVVRPWGARGLDPYSRWSAPDEVADAVTVAVGHGHALAVRADGTVRAWGNNADGQANVPGNVTGAVAVAAGGNHSLALLTNGTVVAWGRNSEGQCTVPDTATNFVAIAAGQAHSLALAADGRIVAWGDAEYEQTGVPGLAMPAVAVAAGGFQSLALRADGRVFAWGWPGTAPANATNITAIAAGFLHALALRADGTVLAWGDNSFGQTNVPAAVTNVIAVQAGAYFSAALRADGAVVVWGQTEPLAPGTQTFADVAQMAAGDGLLFALARQGPPQFGPGLTDVTVGLGGPAVLAAPVLGAGPMSFQWYQNGQPVAGGTNAQLVLPTVGGAAAGSYTLVACNGAGCSTSAPVVLNLGAPATLSGLVAWGDARFGQTGLPGLSQRPVGIAAGRAHNLVATENGQVFGWGHNDFGQCAVPVGVTNARSVAAGGSHSLALKHDGTVVAWGRNDEGQTNVPPDLTNVIQIAAGALHNVALRADGTVVCWGDGYFRQTNVPPWLGKVKKVAAGEYHNLALRADGTVVAWGSEDWVPPGLADVVDMAAGFGHSLALQADGKVVAWGNNNFGQTNVPPAATNIVAIAAGNWTSAALRADGQVFVWGHGALGQTNLPPGLQNVAQLSIGGMHLLALVASGPPLFTSQPTQIVAHAGGSAVLRAEPVGTAPLVGQWSRGGSPLAGATSRFLLLTNVQEADAGAYTYAVSNSTGQTAEFTVQLVVKNAPAVVNHFERKYFVPGQPLSLPAATQGKLPRFFQWLRNGLNLSDAPPVSGTQTEILQVAAARPEDSGLYELAVLNAHGSVTGAVAQAVVTPVVTWGDGSLGQRDVPATALNLTTLAAGDNHTLAARADGTVVAWGDNESGQLDVPAAASNVVAVAAGNLFSLALRADGKVIGWGEFLNPLGLTNAFGPVVPVNATNIVSVAAGPQHALALRADGRVLAWGRDSVHTNVPAAATNIVAVGCGEYQSLAMRADGSVVAWGKSLSLPAGLSNVVQAVSGLNHSLVLRADGTVVEWTASTLRPVPPQATNIVAVAAQGDVSAALRADGRVLVWGNNIVGQTNVPTSLTNALTLAVGGSHCVAVAGTGAGDGGNWITNPITRSVSSVAGKTTVLLDNAGKITAGRQWLFGGMPVPGASQSYLFFSSVTTNHAGTYALLTTNLNGSITVQEFQLTVTPQPAIETPPRTLVLPLGSDLCLPVSAFGAPPLQFQWSRNGENLSDGDRISGAAGPELCLTRLRSGDTADYSVAVWNEWDGATNLISRLAVTPVLAWGSSSQTNVPLSATNLAAVATGSSFSAGLRDDGRVLVWDTSSVSLTNIPVSASNVLSVALGSGFALALRADGAVVAWGSDSATNVPAGLSNVVAVSARGSFGMALDRSNRVQVWAATSSSLTNIPTAATNLVAIAAGSSHALALRDDGRVFAWGSGTSGQTNVPAAATNIIAIAAGDNHNLALRADGVLLAWGLGSSGQTTVPAFGQPITAIAAGASHSLALLTDGRVVAWGSNASGQTNVPALGTNCHAIAAGGSGSLALLREAGTVPFRLNLTRQATLGEVVELSGPALPGSRTRFQWFRNGLLLVGQTNATLRLASFGWGDVGIYTLVASNLAGQSATFATTLAAVPTELRFDTDTLAHGGPGGALTCRLTGAAGRGPVVVFASADLSAWTPVFTNPPVVGELWFTNTPGAAPARFYRAAEIVESPGLSLSLAPLEDGAEAFRLSLAGLRAAGPVVIETSGNLREWSAIATNPPTLGPLEFLMAPTAGATGQFYRAVERTD